MTEFSAKIRIRRNVGSARVRIGCHERSEGNRNRHNVGKAAYLCHVVRLAAYLCHVVRFADYHCHLVR